MKKIFGMVAVLAMIFAGVLFAATDYRSVCTPNGCSQGTMIRVLYNLQTSINDVISNVVGSDAVVELQVAHDADNNQWEAARTELTELKADHDSDNGEVDLVVTELTELKADHDADNGAADDLKTATNSLISNYNSSLVQVGTLLISATAEKFKTTTTAIGVIRGATISKTATDNLVFSANDTVNVGTVAGLKFGAWRVEVGLSGTVYTHSVSADQSYASEAAAIAALPATTTGRYSLGYITVGANTGAAWTANTDDMTPSSDCNTSTFVDDTPVIDITAVSSSFAADLTAANPTGFAADLTAPNPSAFSSNTIETAPSGTVSGDTSLGSGTATDPRIQLTD